MNPEDLQHADGFRDRVSSVTSSGKRKWVYALKPTGKFYKWRNYSTLVYLLVFFGLPFVKVNGEPFILINVVKGKFIIFGNIFWPQDFFIFAVGMIALIIFIVLFTVIYGRLFCGWACPQTIFMEMVFRKIEWWIEGSPNAQKSRNEKKWDADTMWRKGLKHLIFLLISAVIAHTFLAYILSIDEVYKIIKEPISQHLSLFSGLVVFTLLFYGVFAFVRDIVCTTVCPYGRLQSVMFDKDTMQIAYDYSRGEPRGKIAKNATRTEGDCIDCKKCVFVCPTGIDIRDGVQMECVGCTACIDACDEVMDKVGFPKGLIRYASENEISKGTRFHFNNRMKAYSVLLVILTGLMTFLVWSGKSIDTHIKRAQGQLYQELDDQHYGNLYVAKILNKTNSEQQLEFRLENMEGEIRSIGNKDQILKPESVNEWEFFIVLDRNKVTSRKTELELGVYKGQKRIQKIKTNFLGPFK
ncbi:MAG: cytochrome c oxidase accessory protein CcoG [Saprospiraceae bacterium]|nr:cytochrome c oxidase accessory protein CcoG [Saprospiraceae bacterium]